MNEPCRTLPCTADLPLLDSLAVRRLEAAAAAALPPHALMARAGLALARLLRATHPHVRRVWIAAGPGNNGGDGLVLARHLHAAGVSVTVSVLGAAEAMPPDAAWAHAQAIAAGVTLRPDLPATLDADMGIDALLGVGQTRAPQGLMAEAIRRLNAGGRPILAVDVPTGLDADLGRTNGPLAVTATQTLTLLAAKPGLYTGAGREHAGDIWLDSLGVAGFAPGDEMPPRAVLGGEGPLRKLLASRGHAGHKGSYGDVHVVGGAPGMRGAIVLASRAALMAGAGRCFVHPCGPGAPDVDVLHPEAMWRSTAELRALAMSGQTTMLAGCGGGDAIAGELTYLLSRAARLVLDADALNAIAQDTSLQTLLARRQARGWATVLTPHPLEAARLLGVATADVQADRLRAAQALAERFGVVAVLKGSGTVIAGADAPAAINATGNARLATAGTGDVLSGWIAGLWAAQPVAAPADGPGQAREVARACIHLHGLAAELAPVANLPLLANALTPAMACAAARFASPR